MHTKLLLAAALLAAAPAGAAPLIDPMGDFVAGFIGPNNGDLDVLTSEVFLEDGVFTLTAGLAAPIGTTTGGFYVFGFNRGAGTARFGALAPGVLFDSVAVIQNTGTGIVRDLLAGVTTVLDPSAISFSGNGLTAFFNASLLPSAGFAPEDYTFNLWPRSPGAGQSIADFAPDNSNFAVTNVPAPAALALMAAGLGVVGVLRRRARAG